MRVFILVDMTNLADSHGSVPHFEMRHRLALALEWAHVPVSEMAEELGISRNTVGNYLAGRTVPSRAILRVWSLRCGVPFDWLLTGTIPKDGPDSGPGQVTDMSGWTRKSRLQAA